MSESQSPKRRRITETVDPKLVGDVSFLRELIDTFPAMSFVMDEDVTVVAFNATASRFFNIKADAVQKLAGAVINCANAMNTACGRARPCKGCDLRLAINSANKGFAVERKETTMRLVVDGTTREFHLLITSRPYRKGFYTKVLLFIENITEYVTLKRLLPALKESTTIAENAEYKAVLDNYIALQIADAEKEAS